MLLPLELLRSTIELLRPPDIAVSDTYTNPGGEWSVPTIIDMQWEPRSIRGWAVVWENGTLFGTFTLHLALLSARFELGTQRQARCSGQTL
jgi:hypothetical protein